MRKLILSLVVVCAFGGFAAANDDDDGRKFRARLSGEQEVPPVDTETEGRAEVEFDWDYTKAEFTLEIEDGTRVTQAHIHCAPKGENGPVVVFLAGFHDRGWDVDGRWISDATFTDENILSTACGDSLAAIAQSMADGLTYINVHTIANRPGEVRGQLAEKRRHRRRHHRRYR